MQLKILTIIGCLLFAALTLVGLSYSPSTPVFEGNTTHELWINLAGLTALGLPLFILWLWKRERTHTLCMNCRRPYSNGVRHCSDCGAPVGAIGQFYRAKFGRSRHRSRSSRSRRLQPSAR